ncbi:MAG: DUF4252 domain-containing protein [Gammaproteobacteria bacterium]
MSHRIAVALVLGVLSAAAEAGSPRLKLPSFANLESQAVESVDVTFGWVPLHLAGWFIGDDDPDGAEVRQLLKSIKSISVRHYRFGSDFVYSMKDLDAIRAQLSGQGWFPLVQVRDRRQDENVDVFFALDGDKITGVAIIASEPREFTILNIVGKLDMDQVERWAAQAESGKGRRWVGHKSHADGWDDDLGRAGGAVEQEEGGDARLEDQDVAGASSPEL